MKSVHIDIEDDKLDIFLTIIKNLKPDLIKNINILDNSLHIEPINKDSSDYMEIMSVKEENNIKYSLDEVKRELGL